jgi:hypothetical protein
MACLAALLLCGLCPAIATAQSVRGQGVVVNGDGVSNSHFSVDAWLDADGNPQGTVEWIGDIAELDPESLNRPAGPADPWHLAVIGVSFYGNTAYVAAVIVHSVFPANIGEFVYFTFTDNSGTGESDEINFTPIVAGNITVDD